METSLGNKAVTRSKLTIITIGHDYSWLKLSLVFFIFALGFMTSCSTTRRSGRELESTMDISSDLNLEFLVSLGEFVDSVDLIKLCNPSKLIVLFSIDSTGKVCDSDFISTALYDKNCVADSAYIRELKMKFENQMPVLKADQVVDSIEVKHYVIPVSLN